MPIDYLATPLLASLDECIGTIRCVTKKGPLELFTYDDQELLMSVGRQVAQAIQRDRLEEARNRWLAQAVHQVSGPLQTIKGAVDYLLKYREDVTERTKILEEIQGEVERSIKLTDRVELSDRLKSGKIAPKFQSVLLRDFILQTWRRHREDAKKSKIIFRCFCQPDLTAEVDAHLLGEALSNIFANALKFTPHGTFISVRARRLENSVEIKVFDQGPGLTPEAERRYFELYFSIPPPAGKSKGQGLGLYIAQQIVHLHNGRLQGANKGGGRPGAVFTITLPARRN